MSRIRLCLLVAATALLAAALVSSAVSASGGLDPAFGVDGNRSFTGAPGGTASGLAIARVADGGFAEAGTTVDGGVQRALVARLTAAGAFDPAFNGGAPVSLGVSGLTNPTASAVAADADHRTVVAGAGTDESGTRRVFVARLTPSGVLDTSFGDGGRVTLVPVSGAEQLAVGGVALDGQDRIVVAGSVGDDASFVARLTPDATGDGLDTTFAADADQPGVALPDPAGYDVAAAALVLDSNRPLLAGTATPASGGQPQAMALRLTTDGALDSTFGTGGLARVAAGTGAASAAALALVGGRPVLAGTALEDRAQVLLLARLSADGSAPDTTFGDDGVRLLPAGHGAAHATGVAADPQGRLIVVGGASSHTDGTGESPVVLRVAANGDPDTGFATGADAEGSATAVVVQDDGKPVVASTQDGAAVASRYLADDDQPATPTSTAVATLTASPAPSATPVPAAGGGFTAPGTIVVGQPGVFTALGANPPGTHYAWDFDGSGAYATDGDTAPAIRHTFAAYGMAHVGLRVTSATGQSSTSFQDVEVVRPPLANIRWSPAHPKPGQKVRITVDHVADGSVRPVYFSLRSRGFRIRPNSVRLPRAGAGGRPSILGAALPPTRANRSTQAAASASGQAISVRSKVAELSTDGTFTEVFPKEGTFRLTAGMTGSGARVVRTYAEIAIGEPDKGEFPSGTPATPVSSSDCAEQVVAQCPELIVSGDLITGQALTFDAKSPEVKPYCPPKLGRPSGFTFIHDLGYPAGGFQGIGTPVVTTGHRSARLDGGPVAHAAGECITTGTYSARVQSWDFGDGTKLTAPAGSGDGVDPLEIEQHVYKQAGTFDATVVVKVTTGGLSGAGTSFVTLSAPVTIVAPVCKTFVVNDLPVSAGSGCFVTVTDPASSLKRYRPVAGDFINLAGMEVTGTLSLPVLVPAQRRIYTNPGVPIGVVDYPAVKGAQPAVTLLEGPVEHVNEDTAFFPIPKPVANPLLGGGAYTDYAAYSKSTAVSGLPIGSAHIFLSPTAPPKGRIVFSLPPLMEGDGELQLDHSNPVTSKPVTSINPVVAGTVGLTRRARDDSDDDEAPKYPGYDPDFTLDIPDMKVGPFKTHKVQLNHNALGNATHAGWYGGGEIAALGNNLLAPFVPPGNSDIHCAKGGPSGFGVSDTGKFLFGGATLTLASDIALGPVGLHCLQIAGQSDPFVLQGKVALDYPVDTPGFARVDGCFFLAQPSVNQTVDACYDKDGTQNPRDYKVQQPETWFGVRAVLTMLDTFELARAYFDVHTGADLLKMDLGGKVDIGLGIVGVHAAVDGRVFVKPHAAFEIDGSGEVDIPDACPVCISPKLAVIVSTKGMAGCAWVAGFEYLWPHDGMSGSGDVFGGCDLSDSIVRLDENGQRAYHDLLGRDTALPGTGMGQRSARLKVGANQRLAFTVHGAAGAPQLTVDGPGGLRMSDATSASQAPMDLSRSRSARVSIIRLEDQDKTIVAVRGGAKAGSWSFTAQPDGPPITSIEEQDGLPAADPKATVHGNHLRYHFVEAPGRTVTFTEQGPAVARVLGTVSDGNGRFALRGGRVGFGVEGDRRITATVNDSGLPVDHTPALDTYHADGPPEIDAPGRVKVSPGHDAVTVSWMPVSGAETYHVLLKLSDGRIRPLDTTRTSITLPVYDRGTTVRATVRAESRYHLVSPAAAVRRPGARLPARVTQTL